MTTQPQPPVTVTPSLPNRRNAELLLLCFATVITTAAFAIVQANQERAIGWELLIYAAGFLAVFAVAHLAIRRYAPYADPLLLPIVALLNGLGFGDDSPARSRRTAGRGEWPRRHEPADPVDAGRRGRLCVRGDLV